MMPSNSIEINSVFKYFRHFQIFRIILELVEILFKSLKT